MNRTWKRIIHKTKKLLGLKPKWDNSYCKDYKLIFDFYEQKTIKIPYYFFHDMDCTLLALIRDMMNQFTVRFTNHVDNEFHAEDIKKMKDISDRLTDLYKKYNSSESLLKDSDNIELIVEEETKQYEIFQKDLKQIFNDLVDIWGLMWL